MNKTIIVSNRLPVDLNFTGNKLNIKSSVGGLATGMKSVHAEGNGLWVGWSGLTEEEIPRGHHETVDEALRREKCIRVPLTAEDLEHYYHGFSNKALWPLFHYFQAYTEFELEQWEHYVSVNRKFAKVVTAQASPGDTVWVHDYQLLLLPQMIRELRPDLTIGFFLHIPFPSYELVRTCPWRDELLQGVLGADLIGFHTYDYLRHFMSSAARISGLEVKVNEIIYGERTIKVDFFPMGIDYRRYHNAALEHRDRPEEHQSGFMREIAMHQSSYGDARLVLSIDRMDYTKGIPNRIKAFEYFLDKFPQYKGKVRLVMLAVPSRENVGQYQRLKRETDELVGRINGKLATVNWTPVWYFYRSMPFDDLIDLYTASDVALITPIRDGMNLVAKEYVATRTKPDGVLILSEMAGAAKELHEALLVNPNNFEQIAESLRAALEMPEEEQRLRMAQLQKRVARYDVERWSSAFLSALKATSDVPAAPGPQLLESSALNSLLENYREAKKKLLLLDYDGTLVGFRNIPSEAAPDPELYQLLDAIASDGTTDVVLISGRGRATLERWFGHKHYSLVTDHGVWLRKRGEQWFAVEQLGTQWKDSIRTIMESFTDSTPGTFIEEKEYSLAWHYRRADADLGNMRTGELKQRLSGLLDKDALAVLDGNKVIEVKSNSINKGRVAARMAAAESYDFVMAIGDDWTDEYMFEQLPDSAYTIKVGRRKTAAAYYLSDIAQVRGLLSKLSAH